MKGDINLLPPKAIRQRRQLIILKRLGQLGLRIILLEVVLVVMVGVGIVANMKLTQIVSQEQAGSDAQYAGIISEAKAINIFVKDLDQWRGKYRAWSPIVRAVLKAAPSGVVVTDIYAESSGQMTLQGTFNYPEQIVKYQQALTTLDGVKRVEVPLSNYATESDSKFRLVILQ